MCCRAEGLTSLYGIVSAFGDAQLEDPAEVRSTKISGDDVMSATFHQVVQVIFMFVLFEQGKYFIIDVMTFHFHQTICYH